MVNIIYYWWRRTVYCIAASPCLCDTRLYCFNGHKYGLLKKKLYHVKYTLTTSQNYQVYRCEIWETKCIQYNELYCRIFQNCSLGVVFELCLRVSQLTFYKAQCEEALAGAVADQDFVSLRGQIEVFCWPSLAHRPRIWEEQ